MLQKRCIMRILVKSEIILITSKNVLVNTEIILKRQNIPIIPSLLVDDKLVTCKFVSLRQQTAIKSNFSNRIAIALLRL